MKNEQKMCLHGFLYFKSKHSYWKFWSISSSFNILYFHLQRMLEKKRCLTILPIKPSYYTYNKDRRRSCLVLLAPLTHLSSIGNLSNTCSFFLFLHNNSQDISNIVFIYLPNFFWIYRNIYHISNSVKLTRALNLLFIFLWHI